MILIEIDGTNTGVGSDAAVLFFAAGSGGQRRPRPRHQSRPVRGDPSLRGRRDGHRGQLHRHRSERHDRPRQHQFRRSSCNNGPSNVTDRRHDSRRAQRDLRQRDRPASTSASDGPGRQRASDPGQPHRHRCHRAATRSAGQQVGVQIDSASSANMTIGGTTPASRNVMSGNGSYGIRSTAARASSSSGTSSAPTSPGRRRLATTSYGILVEAHGSTIGGSAPGAGNVICGNATSTASRSAAACTASSSRATSSGRTCHRHLALGNQNRGHRRVFGSTRRSAARRPARATSSRTTPAAASSCSAASRATPSGATRSTPTARSASTSANDGVTPNDALDADTGPNGRQNTPSSRRPRHSRPRARKSSGPSTAPSTTYSLDFFANPACAGRPHDFEEGLVYMGSSDVVDRRRGARRLRRQRWPTRSRRASA